MGLSSEDTRTRDDLARVRTELANERTLLAYIRTSLALIVSGVSAMHFLRGLLSMGAGAALLVLGGICAVLGAIHFRKTRRRIRGH
jgi:putative membrane protein